MQKTFIMRNNITSERKYMKSHQNKVRVWIWLNTDTKLSFSKIYLNKTFGQSA